MSRHAWQMLVVTIALVILACMGMILPIELVAVLAGGWLWYLVRTLRDVHVEGAGAATAAICLILLAVGSHYFLAWLFREVDALPGATMSERKRWKWRWTLSLVATVILMFLAGMATVGATHQIGWLLTSNEPLVAGSNPTRDAARRSASANNLKQVGLALIGYEESQHSLPPGGTFDRIGRPLQSWQTLILPYIEQEALYQRVDLTVPWNAARNRPAFETEIWQYIQPGIESKRNEAGYALSHFAASVDVLGGDRPRTLAEISDGLATTLLAGEVAAEFKPWGDPTNWRDARLGVNRLPRGFGSRYPGGAHFLLADGTVRFIKNSIDQRVLNALATPGGKEKVDGNQY